MARFKVGCETGSITFNPTASTNQVVLNGLIEITAGDIIEITRATDNTTIYNRSVVGGVITNTWDAPTQENRITITPATIVSSMSASDELRVYIDYPDKEIPQRVNNIQVGYWAETQVVPVVTTTAPYGVGENIGGINTISSMCRNIQSTVDLTDVSVWSLENQTFSGVIDFWCESPVNGSYTDNNQQVIDGDHNSWLGCVSFIDTDFILAGGSDGVGRLTKNIPGSLKLQNISQAQDIYFTIQVTGIGSGSPRWGGTDNIFVKFGWTKA